MQRRIRRQTRKRQPKIRRHATGGKTAGGMRSGRDASLTIGSAHDPAERAADSLAARALSGGLSSTGPALAAGPQTLHRSCAKCQEEEGGKEAGPSLRREPAPAASATASAAGPGAGSGAGAASGASGGRASAEAGQAVRSMGSGRRMSAGERAFFEPRFGTDFSHIRLHEGGAAARAADAVGARAFAHGSDIAFARNQLTADDRGRHLMAHELAHTLEDTSHIRRNGDWEDDRLYYNTRPEAERRQRRLEGENSDREYRIVEIEIGGATKFRVQSRTRTAAGGDEEPAPEPPGTAPDAGAPDADDAAPEAPVPAPAVPAPAPAPAAPAGSNASCTSRTNTAQIILNHNIAPHTISAPADQASIAVTFSCRPRSFTSEIVNAAGTVVRSRLISRGNGTLGVTAAGGWSENWNGKSSFTNIGTYMAGDGTYRHRIRNLAYAAGRTGDRVAAGGGILSTATQPITISNRGVVDQNPAPTQTSRHLYDDAGAERTANVTTVANAIVGEANTGTDAEKRAIAWAIRNEMVVLNTYSAADAQRHFHFVGGTGGATEQTMARTVLGAALSTDPTSGAIKWYSPISMPPNHGTCGRGTRTGVCAAGSGRAECSGGRVVIAGTPARASCAPAFHTHMTFVAVPGVRQWYFRFYRL